jgi:chromosome segregation ATPase
MSAPETPSDSDPRGAPPAPRDAAPPASHKRPWGWIALAGLLAAGVVGLGIYAMNLNSDLDDANAKIASQQKQIDTAQDAGAGAVAAAKTAYDDLSTKLGAAQQDASQAVEQASGKLDQAEQAAADAKGTADELQTEVDAAKAKAEAASTCAQSFLSALSGVFSGSTLKEGVQATVKELQALQPQCESALSSSS